MKILVACEESQAVTKELRRLGHEAYSCDVQECSGGHPEWHIMDDVLSLINGHNVNHAPFPLLKTSDGRYHDLPRRWDMIIAFPPCTFISNAGNRWLYEGAAQQRTIRERAGGKGIFYEDTDRRLPENRGREPDARRYFRYAAILAGNSAFHVRASLHEKKRGCGSKISRY